MPSTSQPASSSPPQTPGSKSTFRSALGLSSVFKDSEVSNNRSQQPTAGRASNFIRQSVDTPRTYKQKRKSRQERSSLADTSLFKSESSATIGDMTTPDDDRRESFEMVDENMKNVDVSRYGTARRPPVRMDAQDGPWSVSVAETPHDAHSYSLYIKTPTHNLTLTRTAKEIAELHNKLRDSVPGANLPALPIDVSTLPTSAKRKPKSKSNFLNTLSRLASPSSKSNRNANGPSIWTNNISSNAISPLESPQAESADPFVTGTVTTIESGEPRSPANVTITALAAYLTTISNTPSIRSARQWKRFVRVRTDDLESVRVERAIKHVRSDLAAHVSPPITSTTMETKMHQMDTPTGSNTASEASSMIEGATADDEAADDEDKENVDIGKVAEGVNVEASVAHADENVAMEEGDDVDDGGSIKASAINGAHIKTPLVVDTASASAKVSDGSEPPATVVPTAAVSTSPTRVRSQSADPDKRLTRTFGSSVASPDGGTTSASSLTDNDSSTSTSIKNSRRARKKRSQSTNPNRQLLHKKSQRKVVIDDFEMMRVLGKGCAGKVLLVRHKNMGDLYALKAITKRHVLAHQELQHTLTEQAVLKRMAAESRDPFVVKLWWSFHDKENLFLVMDFHPGGDLATQLARWGRLGRDRARFYAAEIVEGVEGLHAAGVIYRDLKPENILIGGDGHIVLTDFGLSKEFPRRTTPASSHSGGDFYSSVPGTPQPASPPWMKVDKNGEAASGWPGQIVGHGDQTSTFCGTAEYLAPEVIQGLPYSFEVDWWSFGTMLYEMLTGITPFWANNHSDMYVRVLQDELQFPDDRAIDQDTKSLIRGLLQRNPGLRMCEPRIKKHPYFSMIDWTHVYYKRYIPPYIPPTDPSNASDTQNFDETFLDMEPVIDDGNDNDQTDTDQEREQTDAEKTDGEESNTTPSQSRSSSAQPNQDDDSVDVFDGYSFKGRHSIILDDNDEVTSGSEEEEDEDSLSMDLANQDIVLEHEAESSKKKAQAEEVMEPKTPEAHPASLTEKDTEEIGVRTPVADELPPLPPSPISPPAELIETVPRSSKEESRKNVREPLADISPRPPAPEPRESKTKVTVYPKVIVAPKAAPAPKVPTASKAPAPAPRATSNRSGRTRREKSGVPALDKYLSDAITEDEEVTEREDEDEDWDFVEVGDYGEDRNGAKGTSLFARGVVDRYRLAVFRKSTPSQRSTPRSLSGASEEVGAAGAGGSPNNSAKQRGRNPGLNFRKHPRQFLRAKSPPPTFSSKSSAKTNTTSSMPTNFSMTTVSSTGMLTPSQSQSAAASYPSLRSKESTTSMGNNSMSSGQSGNGESSGANGQNHGDSAKPIPSPEEPEKQKKQKNEKLKKYKENAEKVLSLFQSSPRQS